MNYTDWNILVITLFQNGVMVNKGFTMRADIEKMDNLMVKTSLTDFLMLMTSEFLRPQSKLDPITNCNNWDVMDMSLFLDDVLYKDIILNRTEFTSNLLESNDFLYNKFIELSGIVISETQITN
jgi:hypothetical protein